MEEGGNTASFCGEHRALFEENDFRPGREECALSGRHMSGWRSGGWKSMCTKFKSRRRRNGASQNTDQFISVVVKKNIRKKKSSKDESQIIRGFVCQATSQFGIYFVGNEEWLGLRGHYRDQNNQSSVEGFKGRNSAESSHGVDLSILEEGCLKEL